MNQINYINTYIKWNLMHLFYNDVNALDAHFQTY